VTVATYSLTTSPTMIDDGTSYSVLVTNTGAATVELSRGGRLRPNQAQTVYPEGAALTAAAVTGTSSVSTSTTTKPLPNAADPATLAANVAFTGTYAGLDYTQKTESALYGWQSALSWREGQQAKVMVLGHSVVRGTSATTTANRFAEKLVAMLRSAFPVTGAPGPTGTYSGYVPAVVFNGDGSVGASNYTVAGGTVTTLADTFGPDGANINMSSGSSITFSFVGTSIAVRVGRFAGQASTMTVTVDGVAGSAQTYSNPGASNTDGEVYNSPDLAYGLHAVTIASSGTNGLRLDGWHVFGGDRTKGIHGVTAGHSGYTSTQLVANLSTRLQPWLTKAYSPNLTVVMCMINDYRNGIASATTAANLTSLVNAVTAAQTGFTAPSVLIVAEWQVGDTGSPVEPWANYVAAAKTVAAAFTNVAVLDLSTRFPNPATDNTLSVFSADLIHPTDRGHEAIAAAIFAFITRGRAQGAISPGRRGRTNVVTASYTATTDDDVIVANASGITVTLPSPSGLAGFGLTIRNASAGNVTVSGTVEGGSNPVLATLTTGRYRSDGAAWWNA
jgi:lysophospholipase L1-like esterase